MQHIELLDSKHEEAMIAWLDLGIRALRVPVCILASSGFASGQTLYAYAVA